MTRTTATATYLVETTDPSVPADRWPYNVTRELVDIDPDRAELPQIHERIGTGIIDAGGRYACEPLPGGRTIEATRLDRAVLDALTRGFVTTGLWADCLPAEAAADAHLSDVDLREYALLQGATREYIADADTDRLLTDYGEAWQDTRETGGRENLEPTPELQKAARVLCAAFLARNADDIEAHMDAFGDPDGGHPGEYVGHTFYLDAAGHGVSFTDRAWKADDPLTPMCQRLCDSAHSPTFAQVEHMPMYDQGDGTADIG